MVALVGTLVAAACRDSWEEGAIRAYNEAAIIAYRTGDPSGLERVAMPDEIRKITALIDLKRADNLVLESSLERLDVLETRATGPDGATVETRERWTYQDRPLTPGAAPGTRFVADMTMRYEYVRKDGLWKVDGIRTLSNEFLEPKGFKADGHGKQHGEPTTAPEANETK